MSTSLNLNNLSIDAVREYLAKSDIKSTRLRLLLRLAVAVRGGLTPADFLRALADTEAMNGRLGHAKVYRKVEARMRSGEYAVYEALEELTTADDRCFLYAEDKVADLSSLLQMAYDTAEKKKVITAAIIKPFLLPMYLFVMACGLLLLGGTVMLPNFVTLMPVAQWEAPSRIVYEAGQILTKYWPFVVGAIAGLVGWVIWSLPNLHNKLRTKYLDRVFPWSLYKSLQSSNFILNIAAMFKAKVPILDAVRGYAMVSTPYSASWALRMQLRLESEQTASDMRALDVGFIDRNTMDSMKILNNKLPADVVIQTIGEAEFAMLADEVAVTAARTSKLVTAVVGACLLFTLYGTMSVIPMFTEKMMASTSQRR
jgi:toxin co-regulated pilus biosynthesis protein E